MDKLIWYDNDGRINCRRGYEVALARLASYEATGMMPDDVENLKLAMAGKRLRRSRHLTACRLDVSAILLKPTRKIAW